MFIIETASWQFHAHESVNIGEEKWDCSSFAALLDNFFGDFLFVSSLILIKEGDKASAFEGVIAKTAKLLDAFKSKDAVIDLRAMFLAIALIIGG